MRSGTDAHDVDTVYHLASLLSVTSEQHPDRAWSVNLSGLKPVLDLAREHDLRVFWPSSIAVFGPGTPHEQAPTLPGPISDHLDEYMKMHLLTLDEGVS